MTASTTATPPEHNVTGLDYRRRGHLRYDGPLIDIHSHVMRTQPGDPKNAMPLPPGPESSIAQAEVMLEVAAEFGIVKTYTMCPWEDIEPLRQRFGDKIGFNGSILKKAANSPDEEAYQLLEHFLRLGVEMLKFWSAPRGRDRGLFVDAPWRKEAARRARAAGVRILMVHVGDPDTWFRTVYTDSVKYGTKLEQYVGFEHVLQEFPDLLWIGAHMGGDVEHPDHLEELLERYPHLYLDTSATKWQVREASAHREAVRALMCRYPERFLFGSDLVTRHGLPAEHYVSRYWCQRTLWESDWRGQSPIADPDAQVENGLPLSPLLHGVDLPPEVVRQVYYENARRLLRL